MAKQMNINDISTQKYFLWFSIALIILFTFMEPAGTQNTSFLVRLFIWTLQVSILVTSLIMFHIILQKNSVFVRLNEWIKILFSGLLGCIFFLPFALGIYYAMGLDDWSQIKNLVQAKEIVFEEISGMFPPVLVTWAVMNATYVLKLNFSNNPITVLVEKNLSEKIAEKEKGDILNNNSEFIAKFFKIIGIDIIYIMSELHYVRVVTSKGEALVLHNLKDAIAELSLTHSGIQTHRSYWASSKHIKSLQEKDGQINLLLSMEKIIPVSRRRLTEVKDFLTNRTV
jgi:hypothetical protein